MSEQQARRAAQRRAIKLGVTVCLIWDGCESSYATATAYELDTYYQGTQECDIIAAVEARP
jgi:hypothetical protein